MSQKIIIFLCVVIIALVLLLSWRQQQAMAPLVAQQEPSSHVVTLEQEKVVEPEIKDVVAPEPQVVSLSGTVNLLTKPAGAKVFLNGQSIGKTPLTITDQPVGLLDFKISQNCYANIAKKIDLKGGEIVDLNFKLKPSCGNLAVNSMPAGATVTINGRKIGVTPYQMTGVKVGKIDLLVSKDGLVDWHKMITIKAGRTASKVIIFARPLKPKAGTVWQEPGTGHNFVWVPGGCYQMGNVESDKLLKELTKRENEKVSSFFKSVFGAITDTAEVTTDESHDLDEAPVHDICVDGVWVGRTEVTNGQYAKFTKATGIKPEWQRKENKFNVETGDSEYYSKLGGNGLRGKNNPVVGVSHADVVEYAAWVSKRSGYAVRLPTEAEWEFICRSGGQDEEFSGGSESDMVAWSVDNSNGQSHEVGQLDPNGLGLFDMSGNVWEWTLDHYDAKAYGKHQKNNPRHEIADGGRIVVRGGSWRSKEDSLRCTSRYGLPPADTNLFLGFRIVMKGD